MKWIIPGIWEKQEAIWLAYPTTDYIRSQHFQGRTPKDVVHKMIASLVPYTKVYMALDNKQERAEIVGYMRRHNIPIKNIKFFHIPHCDIWIRDIFGIFAVTPSRDEIALTYPRFNIWGYEAYIKPKERKLELFDCDYPNKVPMEVAKALKIPLIKNFNFTGEGGGRSFNGKGSMIVCEAVEFQRNPNKSRKDLESIYKKLYGVTHVIWLKKGLAEDYHSLLGLLPNNLITASATGGHIDEFCRFVGPSKVILAKVTKIDSGIARISHKNLEENYKILKRARDQDGNKLEIVRIPLPGLIKYVIDKRDMVYDFLEHLHYKGKPDPFPKRLTIILPNSYINYGISNGVVLIPKYYKRGRSLSFKKADEKARNIMQEVFPNRRVIQLNVEPVNAGGGGMNCITQQQPYIKKKN